MIINCYDSAGKKQCEIFTEEYTPAELETLLDLQDFLGRYCVPRNNTTSGAEVQK